MTRNEVMLELSKMGSEQTKKTLLRHGAREPFFGVKVGDMKKIVKRVKKDHDLSLALYSNGNSDAMYLAGLIADEEKISKKNLESWVKEAYWYMLSEFTVPWLAAETKHGWELGLKWIESPKESIAAAGWSTLSNVLAIVDDSELDKPLIQKLLAKAAKEIPRAQNRVKHTMNLFIIAVGSYVPSLTEKAKAASKAVGVVTVNMGETACKEPSAYDYIMKIEKMGRIGKKKKQARC